MKFVTTLGLILTLAACGDDDAPTGDSAVDVAADSTSVVPEKRRESATPCTTPRPAGPNTPGNLDDACMQDSDCTEGRNGRCLQERLRYCSYDTCTQDSDCDADQLCACGEDVQADVCVKAGCKTDADCGDSYCSPTRGSCGGIRDYQCHTPQDTCLNDSDCDNGFCAFDEASGFWACAVIACAG